MEAIGLRFTVQGLAFLRSFPAVDVALFATANGELVGFDVFGDDGACADCCACANVYGATRALLEPIKARSPMTVLNLFTPS